MAFGLGVAKGMLTTISHLVKPPITIQYPEERLEMPIWTRGRPRLIYEVDTGELRCTACGACALACPVDVIKIEQHPSPTGKGKVLDRFDIDMAGCIECALCVEASSPTAMLLAYSARKNSANCMPLYSVVKPPVSSLSASTWSKGVRLVSARPAIR